MHHSPQITDFITRHSSLFWYIPENKKSDISEDLLVETILNYGDLQAVKQLIDLMGIQEVASRFFSMVNSNDRRRGNFHELTIHFFTLFFNRYAHGNIGSQAD